MKIKKRQTKIFIYESTSVKMMADSVGCYVRDDLRELIQTIWDRPLALRVTIEVVDED